MGCGPPVASQLVVMMDMFKSTFWPRMDFVGQVETLHTDYERLMDAFSHSPQGTHPHVRAFMRDVAQKHEHIRSSSYRTSRLTPDSVLKSQIDGLDPALLCRVAQRLRLEYECLPMYDMARWCEYRGGPRAQRGDEPPDAHAARAAARQRPAQQAVGLAPGGVP